MKNKITCIIMVVAMVIALLPLMTQKAQAAIDMASGSYYMNNADLGKYLARNGTSIIMKNGKLSSISSSVSWYFSRVDSTYFTIKGSSSSSYYLCNDSGATVSYVNKSNIDDSCKWTAMMTSLGVTLKNKKTGFYLHCTNAGTLYTTASSTLSSIGWRIILTSKYGNTSSYTYRELSSLSASSVNIHLSQTKNITLTKSPSSSLLWANEKDFTYRSDDTDIVGISNVGVMTGRKPGNTTITITHKVTGISCTITATVIADASFIGTRNDGHDHGSALQTAKSSWESSGNPTIFYCYTGSHTLNEVRSSLCNSYLFVSRSHGLGKSSSPSSGIEIDSVNDVDLHATELYNFAESRILTDVDLSRNKVTAFIACCTAYAPQNIALAAQRAGANASLGFEKEIGCDYANKWTITFINQLVAGKSISEASYAALHNGWYLINCAEGLDSYTIYGNTNQGI